MSLISERIVNYPDLNFPRRVSKFVDKVVRIKSLSEKSTVLKLNYKKFTEILDSFWADYNKFSDLLYSSIPILKSYTMKQKQKIL